MALIGNGAQSEFQAIAFHRMLVIRELRIFDVDARASAKLEQNLRSIPDLYDLRIVRVSSSAEACKGADIVTTVTADKCNAVILTPPMIARGMHLNAVGGDCPGKTELHGDVLLMPNLRVVVEYEPQSRVEGEIQRMPPDYPVTEFAFIVRGTAPGRLDVNDITLFDSVGFALEDYSALRFLHTLLKEEAGSARQIDLVPQLDDPKDLYGGTLSLGSRSRLRRSA
jgi:ornithine cyclodeaminase